MKKLYVIGFKPKKPLSRIKVTSVPTSRGEYIDIALPRGISKRRCERLWRTLKPTVGSVVLPPHRTAAEFGLPQKCVFSAGNALSRIFLEAALLLFSANESRASEITLCIADRSGKYAAYAERFIGLCKTLKIYTENPCAYFKVCEGMLNRHGCEPIISEKPGGCDVLLLPQTHLICIGARQLKLTADCVRIIGESELPAAVQLAQICENSRILHTKCTIDLSEGKNKINISKIQL